MSKIPQLLNYLKDSPNDAFLNHAIALEYIKVDDVSNALIYFEKNKSSNPNYVATYYHLGKLLESKNEIEQAINIYELGMQIALAAKDQHAYSELRSAHEDLIY